jgi:hypothetical protein
MRLATRFGGRREVGYIPVHVRDYSAVIYGREGDTWKDQDGVRVKVLASNYIVAGHPVMGQWLGQQKIARGTHSVATPDLYRELSCVFLPLPAPLSGEGQDCS